MKNLNHIFVADGTTLINKEERERRKQLECLTLVQRQQIAELQPKASYYDLILQNKNTVPITQIAKDYGMSGRKFNELLHELGVQYKFRKTWLLYQHYAECGYTQSRTYAIDESRSVMHTYWTQKGRLYTNHLPKVGAIDKGTWRRLIVIPFDAKIEGSADIKNYADYLFEKAGGAILTWVIEGARKVIADNYKIDPPQKVRDAIEHYKESNDWLSYFLSERCELDPAYVAKSSEVYNEYRIFCTQVGEFTRSTTDFYTALETVGFERYRDRKGRYIKGLWRQGQKSTVVIHHIISKDTIDEDVMKALKLKEKTQTDLIDAVKARIGGSANGG